jgi:hypothetical protein
VGKNSQETYEEDLEFFEKLEDDPILQESYFKALENKDKLLGYEKTMSGTKNIVDDEVDWYEIKDDVWQDKVVREQAMKKVLQQEGEGPDMDTDYVVEFDAKNNRFVDKKIRVNNYEKRKEEMKEFLRKIEQFEKEKSCVMGVIEQKQFEDENVRQLVTNAKKNYKQFEKKQKKSSAVEKVGDVESVSVPERGWNKKIQHDDEYLAFEKLLQQNIDKKKNQFLNKEGHDLEMYNLHKNYVPRCMTLWQPWASLIVYGIKRFEGRMWNSGYRGPLWIHAGAKEPNKKDIEEVEEFYREMIKKERERNPEKYKGKPEPVFPKKYPSSCLIGVVDVQDVWTKDEYNQRNPKYLKKETSNDFAFVLRNPRYLPIPIKCKGSKEIYEIPKDRAQIATQGLKNIRTDFLEYFAHEHIPYKPAKKEHYEIQYVNIVDFQKKKQVEVSKPLQKVWENGGLIDFEEKEKERKQEKEKTLKEQEPEPKEESPDKIVNIQKGKKKKRKRKRKQSDKKPVIDQTPEQKTKSPKKQEPEPTNSDPFTFMTFHENIESEKDFQTGKLVVLSNTCMAEMATHLLRCLKKSLKHGFENLKTFDIGFFESPNFTSFVKFLIRTRYDIRDDGYFNDLDSLLNNLRFDAVKYENFRKWKRIERDYQLIYAIGDGIKLTDDSRKEFITLQDNQVFVVDQDHCQASFLLKELKSNERAKSSHLETFGGYNTLLLCFHFLN